MCEVTRQPLLCWPPTERLWQVVVPSGEAPSLWAAGCFPHWLLRLAPIHRSCCSLQPRFATPISTQPTLAMQAGLVEWKRTLRDIFTSVGNFFLSAALLIRVKWRRHALIPGAAAAQQQLVTEASRQALSTARTQSAQICRAGRSSTSRQCLATHPSAGANWPRHP